MENFKQKTVRAFFWQGTFKILSQVFTWGITIVLIKILCPEDYGLMGMAMIFIGFMDIFNDIGLGAAIIQKKESSLNYHELHSIFWMGFFVGLLIYIIVFTISPFAAAFFNEAKLSIILRLLGIGFIIGGLRLVPYNLLTKNLQFKKRGSAEFISQILSSLACLIAALNGFGVFSLVIANLIRNLSLCIIVYIFWPFKPGFYFSLKKIRQMFSFGMQVTFSRMLWYFYSNVDYLIIGRFFGTIPLGYYSVAFQLSSMPVTKINQVVKGVTFPAYSSIQENKYKLRHYFLKNLKFIGLILFPALTGLVVVADDFYNVILGEKWLPGLSLFKVLCISCFFRSILTQHAPLLNAIGRPDINVRYTLMLALVMPLAFILVSPYGMESVAIIWVTIYPLLGLYIVLKTMQTLGLSVQDYLRALFIPIISCMIMFFVTSTFQSIVNTSSTIRLLGSCLVGVLTYFSVIWVVSRETIHEILNMGFFLKKKPAIVKMK